MRAIVDGNRLGRVLTVVVLGLSWGAYRKAKIPLSHPLTTLTELLQEATSARDEAEERYLRGDVQGATELLKAVSKKWTAIERSARAAVVFQPDAAQSWAVVFEDAQHAVSHVRATLGSFLVEENEKKRNADLKRAIELLAPSCPTLWFFSRRMAPGDEHVRGEVAWSRCYRDLVKAHKLRGDVMAARVIERDVVAHSTTWLRAKRDAKRQRLSSIEKPKLGKRRSHDLDVRWPAVAPKLRAPRTAHKPPTSPQRVVRNERRVETIFYLSRLSALSASQRAITARDFGRAKAKARAVRRDLEALAEALAEAGDALHRAKVLGAFRDARDRLARDLQLSTTEAELAPAETDEDLARWNAGVALAAMLRASSAGNNNNDPVVTTTTTEEGEVAPQDDENATTEAAADDRVMQKSALEAALDALVAENTPSAVTPPVVEQEPAKFGPAFGRHVAAEAAEYVAVAAGVHAHGWGWLQREAARLEDEQRRAALAIAPAAGPPPGFASRYDVVHVLGTLKTAAVKRADLAKSHVFGSSPVEESADYADAPAEEGKNKFFSHQHQHRTQQTPKKKKKSLKEDMVSSVAPSPAIIALGAVALSAARGTALLREQQRKENDGYSRRRPKRTTYEWVRDLIVHLGLAVTIAVTAFAGNVKKSVVPSLNDDLKAAKAFVSSAWRSLRILKPKRSKPDKTSPPQPQPVPTTSKVTEDAVNSDDDEEEEDKDKAPPPPKKHVVSPEAQVRTMPAVVRDDGELYHAVSTEEEDSDSWQSVPKGGRVVGKGPRLLGAAPAAKPLFRDQDLAANVGTSAVQKKKPKVVAPKDVPTSPPSSVSSEEPSQKRKPPMKIMQRAVSEPLPPPKVPLQTSQSTQTLSLANKAQPLQKKKSKSYNGGKPYPAAEWPQTFQPSYHRSTSPPLYNPDVVVDFHHHGGGRRQQQQQRPHRGGGNKTRNFYQQQQQPRGTSGQYPGGVVAGVVAVTPHLQETTTIQQSRDTLETAIRHQVEYYFSVSNLCKDVYLRTNCMDEDGYVSLTHIASFKRVCALTTDMRVLKEALMASKKLDFWHGSTAGECKVRTNDQPERWSPRLFKTKFTGYDGDDETHDQNSEEAPSEGRAQEHSDDGAQDQ